jgi:hypothetical protein
VICQTTHSPSMAERHCTSETVEVPWRKPRPKKPFFLIFN